MEEWFLQKRYWTQSYRKIIMRIISGYFRGKKILEPKDNNTRPLKDLTKESIFNIINHSKKFSVTLNNSNILDIFSGVGSFGLECLSRGVKNVTFIENYPSVLSILKKNLKDLKLTLNYEIIENDVYDENTFSKISKNFDIIFMDPPYKDKNFIKILKKIVINQILNKNGVIIIHRHKNEKDLLPKSFEMIEEKKYGLSKIIFLTQ